jgi:hypothetical protein
MYTIECFKVYQVFAQQPLQDVHQALFYVPLDSQMNNCGQHLRDVPHNRGRHSGTKMA